MFFTGLRVGSGQGCLSHMIITPVQFLSVILYFWHTCLCSHTEIEIPFTSTNSSWPEQTCRAVFYPVSILASPCSGPTDKKSSFYEEDCGLCFFQFVLMDIVFGSTSEESRKGYSIKYIQFKINYLKYVHSTVFGWLLSFFLQGVAIWSCGSKPSTGDASWRTDYCDMGYLNNDLFLFIYFLLENVRV